MARGLAYKHKKYAELKAKYAHYEHADGDNLGKVVSAPCPCSCYLCGKPSGNSKHNKSYQHMKELAKAEVNCHLG